MEYLTFIIILTVLKESHPLNPEILQYDQYMKDFESTGRRIKQEMKDQTGNGLVMKRESAPGIRAEYKAPYEQESIKVEKMFKKVFPDLINVDLLDWELADEVKEEWLRKACLDVTTQFTPEFLVNQTNYLPPMGREFSLGMETIVRYAPVQFSEDGLKYVTLVNCTFVDFTFYLAQGNDNNHVFCLRKDPKDHIFYFQSGLQQTTQIAEPSTPLQFSDEVCKRICVAAISELLDPFQNFQEKFVEELQTASQSKADEFQEKLDELSRKVYQRKLLLEKVRKNTPCECASEFAQIEEFEDHIDEGYDFLLVRFDKLEETMYEYTTKVNTYNKSHHPGQYWFGNQGDIHKPFDKEWNY